MVVALSGAKLKARDVKRLMEINSIQKALEVYLIANGQYPGNTDNDCGGWDTGNQDDPTFIQQLGSNIPVDPTGTGTCTGYRYYRYAAGTSGCSAERGAFYVLQIVDMESSGSPYPGSPGWSCPSRNWSTGVDWVVGKFEN